MTRSPDPADAAAIPEIERRIEAVLRERMYLEVPSRETDLFATGVLDSLALVDLLVHLEKAFEREIPLTELELDELRTIGGMARLIAARRNGG